MGQAGKSFLNRRGFTLLEIIVVITIILIISGGLTALWGSFIPGQDLDVSALKLLGDLRQAHQFSRGRRMQPGGTIGFGYYGIRFYAGLGENGDRQGWKIIRFCDTDGIGNCEAELDSANIPFDPDIACRANDALVSCEYVKSSVEADNPEIIDNTFFNDGVTIDTTDSDFQVGDTIVFIPLGSATSDGDGENLLTDTSGDGIVAVILNRTGKLKTIKITPLTSYVQIQ